MTASFGYTRPRTGSSLAACSWEPGRLDVFWVDRDRHLQHGWYGHA